jgi:uncharacterized LabA/DUF88 family protein
MEGIDYTSKTFWEPFGEISVFIDAANVFYSQRSMGWTIDFKKFYPFFNKVSKKFLGASFYFALWFEKNTKRANEEKMIAMLKKHGYKVVVKDSKKIKGVVKANCDVELTIDAIRLMSTYDTLVLFSGDGDFAALSRYLRDHGKRVIIVSYRGHISYELISKADLYVPLDKFEKHLKYKKPKK